MPKFSVVIAVYNKEKYIADTLRSVLAQDFTDYEIVILNDGSTDASEAEILKFKDDRIRYFSEENMGAGAARNYAIKKAKGDYIALLDADDYWFPFYLETQNNAILKFQKEFVFATATKLEKNGTSYKNSYSIENDDEVAKSYNYFEGSKLNSLLHSSSTILKPEVFETVGYYDPTIKSGQDTDLYIRIGLKYNVVFSPKTCVTYIMRKSGLFQTTNKLKDKVSFEKYEQFENDNIPLKQFLDLNRYSLCILAKLEGNSEGFRKNVSKINLNNLSSKQRFLLTQNRLSLQLLMWLQKNLKRMGIQTTTFKK